jgi:hypothetical protein
MSDRVFIFNILLSLDPSTRCIIGRCNLLWDIAIACGLLLGITSFLYRQRRNNVRTLTPIKIKIRPAIRTRQFDGWVSLELEAANQSDSTIWLKEAEFLMRDLDAIVQTAFPDNQNIPKHAGNSAPRSSVAEYCRDTVQSSWNPPGKLFVSLRRETEVQFHE